jgi:hypothetical protein
MKWPPMRMMMVFALTVVFASFVFVGVQFAMQKTPDDMCRLVQNQQIDTCGSNGVLNAQ